MRRCNWGLRQVLLFINKTIYHLFPLLNHLNTGFFLVLQNISHREKSHFRTTSALNQYSYISHYVGFLHTNEPCQCGSLSLYRRILFILHPVLWFRHDRHQTVSYIEGQNTVFLSIIRVMIKVFIGVTVISVITLITLIIV